VSNHYSQLLAEAAARDSSLVLVLTVVGVILLPFTFAAVRHLSSTPDVTCLIILQALLTAPVFDFTVHDPNWVTISRKLGWKIWGAISGVAYFIFLLIFLGHLIVQECQRKKQEKEAESKRGQTESPSAGEVPLRMPDREANHDGRHGTNGSLPSPPKNFTKGRVFANLMRRTVKVEPARENETV
jgi:uncharacterized membrane protein